MPRVIDAEVKEIFDTQIDTSPFILAATNLVTNVVVAADCDPALDTAELKEIERWLAAHFACLRDPIALRSKIGDSEAWLFPAAVTTAWSKGLGLTPYGQTAMVIDRSGALAAMGQKKASFRAAPRESSDNFTEDLT